MFLTEPTGCKSTPTTLFSIISYKLMFNCQALGRNMNAISKIFYLSRARNRTATHFLGDTSGSANFCFVKNKWFLVTKLQIQKLVRKRHFFEKRFSPACFTGSKVPKSRLGKRLYFAKTLQGK